MGTDWKAFADDINTGVLLELGTSDFYVEVPAGTPTRNKTGKRQEQEYLTYPGTAVMGKYNSEFPSNDKTIIQAGDVKFVAQFKDSTFEPVDKKNEMIYCKGVKYTIESVGRVAPDGDTNIVFVIQARRVR
jgi:hypothetical protein